MPKRFPYNNVTDVTPQHLLEAFDIISNRKFDKPNFQILVNTQYGLQGVAYNFFPGAPENFGGEFVANNIADTPELQKLERCCDSYLATEKRFGGEGDIQTSSEDSGEKIDPATILFIIQSIMQLIQFFKNKK